MKLRILAMLLAVIMVFALAAGCASDAGSSTETTTPAPSTDSGKTDAPADTGSTNAPADSGSDSLYPLTDGHTFTCWWALDNNLATIIEMEDHPYFIEVAKITGVNIDFTHPTYGGENEAYNLLIASGEYTDFIAKVSQHHTRGLDDLVDNEIALDMKPLLNFMPNMVAAIEAEDCMDEVVTDAGYIVGIPMINHYNRDDSGAINGILIRQDWLNDLGIASPETLDEFEDTLVAFRDNYGASMYYGTVGCGLWASYNLGYFFSPGYIYRDGAVRYDVLEPGFKEYVETMHDWYEKDLIWKDFVSESMYIAMFNCQPQVANGEFGIFYDCYCNIIPHTQNGVAVDPDFELAPVLQPTHEKGETLHTGMVMSKAGKGMLAFTTQLEDVELACKYWDYGFSHEGMILANYGLEGDTLVYDEDGNPHYTEKVYKNEDPSITPYVGENIYVLQNFAYYRINDRSLDYWTDVEFEAYYKWASNVDTEYTLPSLSFTADENTEIAVISGDINTLVNEYVYKFITGTVPLTEWDSFIGKVEQMNIARILEIYEGALARYYAARS